jgi:hypothetical protein
MNLIPTKMKIKIAAKGLGLSNDHLKAADSLISRLRENEIMDMLLPNEVTDLASMVKIATDNSENIVGVIPSEALKFASTMMSSQKGRTGIAKILWNATQLLTNDERDRLAEVLSALADSQLISDRTEFDNEIEFISEAILPWVRDKLPNGQVEERGFDTHADIVCRCPFCQEVFIPKQG